jgi:hypothetical protein
MTTNGNAAIVQQLTSKQSSQSEFKSRSDQDQSDITDDARMAAREDAIKWGKAYKKYLEDYKEEARMIINERILTSSEPKTKTLDLNEEMFFSDTFFTHTSREDG